MKYNDLNLMRGIFALGVVTISQFLFAAEPVLDAKSAILVDERSGVVLWQKDPSAIRYPASITKILTAILLLEHTSPDDVIYAPADTEQVEGASLHLKPGESLTAADLLKAILLRSANDACHALAVHVSGSDLAFAELMNQRAKQIGCTRSHFMAPHGLHNDKHYTTAYDMALISREALLFPEIRQLVKIRRQTIERSINKQDQLLISKNKWLDHDKSADGIKTGYTKVARATFVGSATRNGFRFISVILKSEKWEEDQKALMNWGFANCTRSVIYAKGTSIGEFPIDGGASSTVSAVIEADVHYAHLKTVEPQISIEWKPKEGLVLPVLKGCELGTAVLSDGSGWQKSVPIFAGSDVQKAVLASASSFIVPIIAIVLGGASYGMRRKSRRWSQPEVKRT